MVIIKDETPKYRITVEDVKNILQQRIQQEHGDSVVVTAFEIDPEDSTWYIIKYTIS